MIRAKDCIVETEGRGPELMAEFVCIVRSLKKHGVLDTKDVDYVNKLTDMSSEELGEMLKECKKYDHKGDV